MDLTVTSGRRGDRSVLTVAGEIDVYTAPVLREHLSQAIAADRADVVVDLSGVTFMDSTGLGVLVGALKRARSFGGDLQLVVPSERVLAVFRLTGLTQVFTIHADVAELPGD